jgi:hypothetical protein
MLLLLQLLNLKSRIQKKLILYKFSNYSSDMYSTGNYRSQPTAMLLMACYCFQHRVVTAATRHEGELWRSSFTLVLSQPWLSSFPFLIPVLYLPQLENQIRSPISHISESKSQVVQHFLYNTASLNSLHPLMSSFVSTVICEV